MTTSPASALFAGRALPSPPSVLKTISGVEVVALLAQRVEERRQRRGQVLRQRVAACSAELHFPLHLDAGLLEQRLQRISRQERGSSARRV